MDQAKEQFRNYFPIFNLSESYDFRHSRAGGKPVFPGALGSRLRGNDAIGVRKNNSCAIHN